MKRLALLIALIAWCMTAAGANAAGLVFFTQPGCGPCQRMRPVVARLKARGVQVVELDTTTSPLAARLKVKTTPTFVAVDKNGNELQRIAGPAAEAKLTELARAK